MKLGIRKGFVSHPLVCTCCWVPNNTCGCCLLLRETQNHFTVARGLTSRPSIVIPVIFFSKSLKPPLLSNDIVMMCVVLLKFFFHMLVVWVCVKVLKHAGNVSAARRSSSVLLHCQHGCQDFHLVMLPTVCLCWCCVAWNVYCRISIVMKSVTHQKQCPCCQFHGTLHT